MPEQNLTNPQSWNGYSYVLNNPLSLIDPTGACSIKDGDTEATNDPGEPCVAPGDSTAVNGGPPGGVPPDNSAPEYSIFSGQTPTSFDTAYGQALATQQLQNPALSAPPAPNNGEPPSACLIANINAVNAVSKLNVNLSNVVGQPFLFNGGLDVNFSVPGASPSQLHAGRYAPSVLTQVLGIGHSLHVPGRGGADPSTYGIDPATGNFTFTTHIDTAYSTWHTPIGALIHLFVDVRDKGAHRRPC